ncbi:Fic family protein [Brachybacterium hainanense]|uniref:Fic family protein n=1 Tax=Brachybacterium hainanense TaxID=1541174 RepID=A0ABV6R9M3_9MICO
MSPETDATVASAERAVLALNRSAHKDLGLVARFLLRSEAIASSYIEGIAPSPRNVALAELGQDEEVRGLSEAAQEVARNMTIVREASDSMAGEEIVSVADVERLQRTLVAVPDLQGIRGMQNWIGGSAYHPLEAAHVPPAPEDVPELLDDLVRYMNGAAHSPIIQAALVHAQFETIHPFPDGNGRVGRALIHTVLTRRGLTADAILPVSLVLATLHERYIEGLTAFRWDGTANVPEAQVGLDAWIRVFAEAVTIAAQQAAKLEQRLGELRSDWEATVTTGRQRDGKVRATRRDSALSMILDALPGTPVLTTATVTRMHGVNTTAAQNALQQLTDYGLLETLSIGRNRRAYVSLDVLDLITMGERAMASKDFDTAVSLPSRPVPVRPAR